MTTNEQRFTRIEHELEDLRADHRALRMSLAEIQHHTGHLPEIHHFIEGMKVLGLLIKWATGIVTAIGAVVLFVKGGGWPGK